MKKIFIPFLFGVFISACSTHVSQSPLVDQSPKQVVIPGKLFASVFVQKAAEYKALCYQAYNIARLRVDHYSPQSEKPLAIITDLDETALDNSPYEVKQTLQGKDFEPQSWTDWVSRGIADTLAGSVSFFNYAASRGYEVFYVTNRVEREFEGTLANLKRYGFPYADSDHLIVKKNVSSKEARRQAISQTHEIVMLIGDNLSDFSSIFDKKTMEERDRNTRASASEFGDKFIVLPNTSYGDWEPALYHYKILTTAQKDSVIKASVRGY